MVANAGDGMLDKVRKLIAKAEGTTNADEAAAFFGKAQELMTRYQIDQIELEQSGQLAKDEVVIRTVEGWRENGIEGDDMWMVLGALAKANGCRSWRSVSWGYRGERVAHLKLAGFSRQINLVEEVFTLLHLQLMDSSTRAMRTRPDKSVHGKTYRRSWIRGWTMSVCERLSASAREAEQQAGSGMELVLRNRLEDVSQHLADAGIKVKNAAISKAINDPMAYADGKAAGRTANLSGSRNKVGGSRRGIEA